MKLRYYMRGLGIGILVTAILMSVTLNGKTEELTDDEIIARAEELGMVPKYDNVVLADIVSDNQIEEVSDNQAEKEPEVETATMTEPEQEVSETDNFEASDSESEEKQTDEVAQIKEIETDQMIEITVQGGDGSMTVSRKLKDAGLIADVSAYDRYLCANGYDKRICTGTHSIPMGASEEEIAKLLTARPN